MQQIYRIRLAWVALLLVAFLLRWGTAVWWQSRLGGNKFGFADSYSYWHLGRTIALGEPYTIGPDGDRVFRTPGYPLQLASLFWVGAPAEPPVLWARWQNCVIGTISVGLTGLLAGLLLDRRSALMAAAMAGCYPGAIAMSILVLSEAPFCLLMLCQLLAWVWARRRQGRAMVCLGFTLSGLAAGAATLVRPSWLLFTPIAALIFLLGDRSIPHRLPGSLCMLLGLLLMMAPWWIRNYHVTGAFVPTTLQVGASLYDGLHGDASGASDMRFVPAIRASQRQVDQERGAAAGTFEQRVDRRMRKAALRWAQLHPLRVLQLAGIKFVRMWSPWPNAPQFQNWTIGLVLAIGYAPLMILALWGAWKLAAAGWPYWLCLLPALYLTCLHLVFVSSIRYREPAMLPLIVLAAGALSGRKAVAHSSST